MASATSTVKTRRDGKLGVVSRVESLTRGINISLPGVSIEIGGVYAVAETRAKGRPGTAETTYDRMLWGVRAVDLTGEQPVVHCEMCATEEQMQQLAEGLSTILGDRGQARVPDPDGTLREGTPGGYQAGIQLDDFQNISNMIVNGDGAPEVAAFEITIFNDSQPWGRQRQIFQFAGTLANSQYGIFCLGGGEAEGGKCVLPPLEGGAITVSLEDGETGEALSGATFEVDGPESGSCATDAAGRCTISDLEPGQYTISETQAPDGYLAADDLTATVNAGSATSARFVNLRNAGRIEISLADAETGEPLANGEFTVWADQGGDGTVDPTDPVFATCATADSGLCTLEHANGATSNEVPLGSYAVEQTAAPAGYEAVADRVPFTLELPGQVAALPFTNGSGATGAAVLSSGTAGIQNASAGSTTGGGGFSGFLDDFFDNFRNFLRRGPGEALLMAASTLLFAGPLLASWRRRLLLGASDADDH